MGSSTQDIRYIMSQDEMFQEYEEKRRKDGFFPQLYKAVCHAMGDENIDKLETMRDDMGEMIKFTYELKAFKDALEIKEFFPEKNLYESKAKKDYGNKAYKDGKDLDALYHYSQAIIAAPVGQDGKSRELSILLANRSAVLFSLKAYGMALDDINLAFRLGYPDDLAYKLYDRKAKCLVAFKQMADAGEAYKLALKYVDKATKLSGDRKTQVQREIMQALAFFKNAPAHLTKNQPEVSMVHQAEVPEIPNKNSLYPVMSDAITFKYEENRGRFAIASRDIVVGEVLTVEKAIVSHMLPEYMGRNCTHCFKSMKAPLPCPTCTKVMFCSMKCRTTALSTYHKYECKLVDLFLSSGMSIICFLALRTVTQKPLQWFRDNREMFELSKHDKTSGETKEQKEVYESSDYRNYFNLVSHHDERKTNDMFHRAMFSVFLLRCLQSQGYFPDSPQETLTEDEHLIGNILCHFLEVLQFNAHEVAQFEMVTKTSQEGAKSAFIGAAVYPTLALFNHSCDPSIVRYYVEDYVVVQAIKNIFKGEEICENYGPIFFHSAKDDRQSRLEKQYWFKCQCIACQENWPLMHEMTQDVLNFRCGECGGSAPFHTSSNMPQLRCGCGTPINLFMGLKGLTEMDELMEAAHKELEANNLEKAQEMYTSNLLKLDKVLAPPYPDYYKIQQQIWKCI